MEYKKQGSQFEEFGRKIDEFNHRFNLAEERPLFELFKTRVLNVIQSHIWFFAEEPDIGRLYLTLLGKDIKSFNKGVIDTYLNLSKTIEEFSRYIQYMFIVLEGMKYLEIRDGLQKDIENVIKLGGSPIFLYKDEDTNEVKVMPSGCMLLDKEIVLPSLEWLVRYPSVKKIFIKALLGYLAFDNTNETARTIYDDLRSSFELLLKNILNNNRTLENNAKELKDWMTARDVHPSIIKTYTTILAKYEDYMNDVKHVRRYNGKELEFMIYQTSLFIFFISRLSEESDVTET